EVSGVAGVWKDLTNNVNLMASNLTDQVRNIAEVTTAMAKGDLSRKITVEVKGEILRLKDTINTMVDQLNAFASEVTRVAREVGTEGKLGGQAEVKGVAGVWKDLTDNVNFMASNLTNQVRRIAVVVTAVAKGELNRKLTLEARGEIATLAETINNMIDTLATFADQVTTMAREVGVEGKLGGQARVPGATGTWRDLTDNVNRLAANLTTQVRAIADVATAVTKGDLTQSIAVEARGEVEALKDNINEMIRNLRETTRKNAEQDWLKTNLAKFTRMLQGQRDLETVARQILSEMAPLVEAQYGAFYSYTEPGSPGGNGHRAPALGVTAGYACPDRKTLPGKIEVGEGLVGQCAMERRPILVEEAPPDYIRVGSGLGSSRPSSVVVLPVLFEEKVKAVIELASFSRFSAIHLHFMEQLTESIGIVLNTIEATMRTEDLLKQSQTLAQELQQINAELEEKADQLARTSKYKSDFLANMSHELRTPLNSLLILAKMLYENRDGNLSPKQVEFAKGIHSSGTDLLALINDILDLSKIESGTTPVEVEDIRLQDLAQDVELNFRHVAQNRRLGFDVELDPLSPPSIQTDAKRLQQVLRNLLSNAFKFTPSGRVTLRVGVALKGWSAYQDTLNRARAVVAFAVMDTGIGIPPEKHRMVFEPFHQADMTTSRKYGGTGLGLSISREIARMLGGELRLESAEGQGSTFTLYLPDLYVPPRPAAAQEVEAADVPAVALPETGETVPLGESQVSLTLPRGTRDDRAAIVPGDRVLLIVEDDMEFASEVLEAAHALEFKGLIAHGGEAGLIMARRHRPHAITLDIRMADMDGWALLDYLKHDPETRHIPVQIISVVRQKHRALRLGAFAHLAKPASRRSLEESLSRLKAFAERRVRRVILVEDEDVQRRALVDLLSSQDVEIVQSASGGEALEALKSSSFDCMVLDLTLPDMTGFEVLERLKGLPAGSRTPVVIYTGRDLGPQEESSLRKVSRAIIVKDARSPGRLLDEVALFLHRPQASFPEPQRQMLRAIRQNDPALSGKQVLIADDDIRNIFALTSVLERSDMKVRYVQNGREAVESLQNGDEADIVLMDIMMPELDGYEAIRRIRKVERFQSLPIIALTAKAMKGDRERCIEAGASDYIPKPVDTDRLLSLIRVWLQR
ncbi:MAG TPA: response regulator, partial [Candidatus Polarisedimenticolia bacterium]|nr:response regulator [Candidatus Polarisedimenticolia bacterium]